MKKSFLLLETFFMMMTGIAFADNAKSSEIAPRVKLNTDYEMPVLGLGTWTLTGESCENAVYSALKSGYRLIDTAEYYENEVEVGNALFHAIRDGIVTREEVFLATKVVPWSANPDADIDESLRKLKVNYIDLVLLHQHGSGNDKVYAALIRAKKAGKIRSIGISNFYTEKSVLHFINDFDIPPAVVQNENHIFYQNTSLRDWAKKRGIYIESYYPFGGRGHTSQSLKNPVILKIAAAHKKTAAQIIARWHVQSGFIAVPGSSNSAHIVENIDIFDFELSKDEMNQISALNMGKRYESW